MPCGFGHVLEAQIGGRKPETQDIGIAKIADDAARDQRLADRVSLCMAERQLAATLGRISRTDEI